MMLIGRSGNLIHEENRIFLMTIHEKFKVRTYKNYLKYTRRLIINKLS